ncbi:MAG TPA: prolyl oligopeptidase family serine peptidase [Candidatus Dormibacteraeota bacterium]|nr:prolyl oligopeptidase family serine peptidase [Candidatus Dormibacteraeota bacterium]
MRRALGAAMAALLTACSSSTGATPAASPPPTPSQTTTSLTGSIGAAQYRIEVPATWNGTLFLYSHGYVAPGRINPATDSPAPLISSWLLGQGFAIAGSSYSSTGWALEDAFKDQIALLDLFNQRLSKPKRVIAWGGSLGGIITAGLVQLYPDRFAGAIPLCGVLAGGVASWNTGLDAAYAFKTLLAPATPLQLVGITDPQANFQLASQVFDAAAATAQGRARIALVAALGAVPGWFDPAGAQPAPTDYAAQEAAQALWESQVDFPFEFQYRSELERRAGGNPSWNTGVDYTNQLAISSNSAEVTALYAAAGLDLAADLRALNSGARIKADPNAVAYLNRFISFDGTLRVPVLTMHTIGDGLVVPQNETAYSDVVSVAGNQDLLRQVFVHRAGHCAFSAAETITVIELMLARLDAGNWGGPALAAGTMNDAARALGDTYSRVGGFFISPPAFETFTPGPYPRPFAKGSPVPT